MTNDKKYYVNFTEREYIGNPCGYPARVSIECTTQEQAIELFRNACIANQRNRRRKPYLYLVMTNKPASKPYYASTYEKFTRLHDGNIEY